MPLHAHRLSSLEQVQIGFQQEQAADRHANADMQARLVALEKDSEWMRSNYVTRADLQKELRTLLWQIVGALVSALGLYTAGVYFIVSSLQR